MRSHFLHNIVTTSALLFCAFSKFLNGWKDKKLKCIGLLRLEVESVSEVYGIANFNDIFPAVCWKSCGLLQQYV